MRIIAGLAKGIKLTPPPPVVRPPLDRIKEAVFASLEPLVGKVVVDLFAGSGSMGLEALSRGASAVYMIEQEPRHARIIRENVAKVTKAMDGEAGLCEVIVGDATQAARLLPGIRPEVVLADPPFALQSKWKGAVELLTNPEFVTWTGDALLVLRQSAHHAPFPSDMRSWRFLRDRRYGESIVYYLRAAG